jgi:hypothetical protein
MPRRIGNSQLARATIYRGFHRSEIARTTFPLLGTNALGAIPQLRSMMHDTSHPQTAVRSIAVLSRVGPEAFEIMEGGLGDTNQPFREQIAMMMGIYTARYVGTNACLSPLRTAMVADPDSKVRAAASNMVLRLAGTNGGADSR